ncbi:TRAP transporter small permease [Falsirhodobacter deserti]|uniref:TRAP transporter small permease n=1 Tax=Falsirhodobacter deserti TaxID=1365611 RepID=UPI000FE4440E|nr:TRAP transporter small permease [Falsirhodobacter deserti]
MVVLIGLAHIVATVNAALLALGRYVGMICLTVMVVVILVQVFCRYVLGNALAWPDETSRFLMLWLTGLMAPTAFRRGGFVAIEMLRNLLPALLATLVALFCLALCALVLWFGIRIGWSEATGFSGRFDTVSMNVPTSLDLSEWRKVPRAWMMASLATGVTLLFAVNIELILRSVITLMGGGSRLPVIPETQNVGAE